MSSPRRRLVRRLVLADVPDARAAGTVTMTFVEFSGVPVPDGLTEHFADAVGVWPPRRPVAVAANPRRELPEWDGVVRPVYGVVTERGDAAIGFVPDLTSRVPAGIELAPLLATLPEIVGAPGQAMRAVLRWTTEPTATPDDGVWLPVTNPRVPAWLHPFGGEVLLALDDDGRYLAGVGVKRHDRFAHELAVVTQERARGRGLARRLVAQAARRVLAAGAVPTYLHAAGNEASARVARAAGFPDTGWQVLGFFPHPPGS